MKELSNFLEKESFRMKFRQGNLETLIDIDKKNDINKISAYNLDLIYDQKRMNEDTEKYVSEQLKAHQDYEKLIKGDLSQEYQDVYELLSKESDVERMFQFIPENANRAVIKFVKFFLSTIELAHFKFFKKELKGIIAYQEGALFGYSLIEKTVNEGKEFLDKNIEIYNNGTAETIKNGLAEWRNAQKELSFCYSQFSNAADKRLQAIRRVYYMFYPKEQLNQPKN